MSTSGLSRAFTATVAAILLLTAGLKVTTLMRRPGGPEGQALSNLLAQPAPYLPYLTNRQMMWVAVGFELTVLTALGRLRTHRARLLAIAFVGGLFAAYHIGLGLIGYRPPCGCLGGPLEWLHLSRRAYDTVTLAIIAYLLTGSYGLLLWERMLTLRRVRRAGAPGLQPSGPSC